LFSKGSDVIVEINQKAMQIDGEPTETVLEFLRRHGLKGTKEGCASGDCGACTVMVADRATGLGRQSDPFKTFNACIAPIGQFAGESIVTVEGLAQGDKLHPAQQSMMDCHGSQCGFCTPGFVMSLAALVENGATDFATDDDSVREQVQLGISGNLCRCTGYKPIVEAGQAALAAAHDSWLYVDASVSKHQSEGVTDVESDVESEVESQVKNEAANQGVYLPESLKEMNAFIMQFPTARLIAGGTDLMLEVTQLYRDIDQMISVNKVAELTELTIEMHEGKEICRIGAAVTYQDIELALGQRSPALVDLLHRLGSTQIRNRGTLGGNFGNGSPIADMPPVFMVLDGVLNIGSSSGAKRASSIEDFYLDYRQTSLAADEYIVSVEFPVQALTDFHRFYKNSKRIEDDISSVLGAFRFEGCPDQISKAAIAFGGMAAMPVKLKEVEAKLEGATLDDELMSQAVQLLSMAMQPMTDVRASAAYRLRMAQTMLERALREFRGEHLPQVTEARHA
jgi:xanthine dehydrogenase small subunit